APHSSNWDGIWGFAAKLALGLEIRVLGKAQLFRWPLGPLLRRLGVIPIDRSAPQGTVGQAVELIRRSERIWYTLAPEGTRKRVERWKTGFWKIAHDAQVPILPAYFHYPDKVIGLGPPFRTSGDMDADLAALRQWYRPWQGRHRGTPCARARLSRATRSAGRGGSRHRATPGACPHPGPGPPPRRHDLPPGCSPRCSGCWRRCRRSRSPRLRLRLRLRLRPGARRCWSSTAARAWTRAS